MDKRIFKSFLIIVPSIMALLLSFIVILYLFIIPSLIQSKFVENNTSKITKDLTGLDLKFEKPTLKTYLKPQIDFKIKKLYLTKNNKALVDLEEFDSSFDLKNIFNKEIKLNKLIAKKLTVKSDELLEALEIKKTEQAESDWKIDLYSSIINLDNLFVTYKQKNNTKAEIKANDVQLDCNKEYKALGFNSVSKIFKNDKEFAKIIVNSKDEIKLFDNNIKVDNLDVLINDSKVKISSTIDEKNVIINAKSEKFDLDEIFSLINSNFIIPNGQELLAPLKNPKGSVKFDVTSNNNNLSGYILVDNTKAEIKDLSSIPINIQKGKVKISKNKIDFENLTGYYGKSKKNELLIKGDIKDYYNSVDSNIDIITTISNEFLKNYLAPLMNNTVISLTQGAKTKIIYKSKYNKMDLTWLAKLNKGNNLTIQGQEQKSLSNYERAVKGDFHIENNKLEIKNINYYISNEIKRGKKLTPILVLDGKMNLNGDIDNIGFSFGRQMPCEFLNIFAGPGTFKKGTIKGSAHIAFKNKIPTLVANMEIEKTILPNQRLFIKSAHLTTDNNLIKIVSNGGFKRIKFDFSGKIKNELQPPFVIKNMELNLDEVDVEKLLLSFNNQETSVQNADKINSEQDIQDDNYFFDTNLIRIEDADFSLKKGNYKELTFSDIEAEMSLNENGILNLKSNRFKIANGFSSLKVQSDLKNLTHYIKLGVLNVDSNLMAKTLLNLDKEISGKAKGIIELNTDKDLKMNGQIKFAIDDGAIGKIGLVEYLLKIASVFRNPIVMISPSVLMDVINIPEGKFKKITGTIELKNNVARKIDIKSTAPTLSALIRGRYDMERHDASIRIYTRFSTEKKSLFGFLRNISLNALANKVQMNTRNDLNYYSAELVDLPQIEIGEERSQIFLTQIEGDVEHNNYLSSLKKLK